MRTTRPASRSGFVPNTHRSPDAPGAAPARQLTSQRIAADLEAFYARGGSVEVLGVTRVTLGPRTPPAPVAKKP